MEYSAKRIIIIRVWEFLKLSISISLICTLLDAADIFSGTFFVPSVYFVGALGYFILNMVYAKRCYIALGRKQGPYLVRNTVAYLIYTTISLLMLQFAPGVAQWVCSIMVVLDFCISEHSLPAVVLALPFHVIGYLLVALVPAYMKYGRGILRIEKLTKQ